MVRERLETPVLLWFVRIEYEYTPAGRKYATKRISVMLFLGGVCARNFSLPDLPLFSVVEEVQTKESGEEEESKDNGKREDTGSLFDEQERAEQGE